MAWFEDLKVFTSANNAQEKAKAVVERLNLDSDGRPKTNGMEAAQQEPARTSMSQPPQENRRISQENHRISQDNRRLSHDNRRDSTDLQSNTNVPASTPRLDNQTNTITTSSIPDTNDFEIDHSIPNIYIDIPANEAKNRGQQM